MKTVTLDRAITRHRRSTFKKQDRVSRRPLESAAVGSWRHNACLGRTLTARSSRRCRRRWHRSPSARTASPQDRPFQVSTSAGGRATTPVIQSYVSPPSTHTTIRRSPIIQYPLYPHTWPPYLAHEPIEGAIDELGPVQPIRRLDDRVREAQGRAVWQGERARGVRRHVAFRAAGRNPPLGMVEPLPPMATGVPSGCK